MTVSSRRLDYDAEIIAEFRARLASNAVAFPPLAPEACDVCSAQDEGTLGRGSSCAVPAPAGEAHKSAPGVPPSAVVGPLLTASAHGVMTTGARTSFLRRPLRLALLVALAASVVLFVGFVIASQFPDATSAPVSTNAPRGK